MPIKKLANILIKNKHLIFINLFLFLPVFVLAQENNGFVPCIDNCDAGKLLDLFNDVINFVVFRVTIWVATVVIIIAGIMYVLYPYNPGYKEQAKKAMIGTLVGLAIILSAYLIIKFIVLSLVNPETVPSLVDIFSDIPDTAGDGN